MPKTTRLLHVTSSSLLAFLVILVLSVHDSHQNLEASVPDFMRREHSLIKPYGGGGGIPSWDFIGSTIVTNKFVRLTSDSQSLQGALWNTLPVDMTDWEVQFQFSVHGKGKDLFGDGFVFWYVRDRNQFGPVFGSKDYFHGLAIILDTYSNHNGPHNHPHPYISAMVNNGSLHYDHDKDGTHTELAGCEAPFRNRDYDTFVAVRYQNYKLTVSMDIDNKNEWKECFSVDHVRLPTRYHFGFSAATGDLSDNHDIISVKTYGLDSDRKFEKINPALIEPVAETFAAPREHAEDDEQPSQAWRVFKIIFIIILVISLLMVIAYVSYVIYDKQKRTKKRFY